MNTLYLHIIQFKCVAFNGAAILFAINITLYYTLYIFNLRYFVGIQRTSRIAHCPWISGRLPMVSCPRTSWLSYHLVRYYALIAIEFPRFIPTHFSRPNYTLDD